MIDSGQIYSLNSSSSPINSSFTNKTSIKHEELSQKQNMAELSVVRQLQSRDQEVRSHESAHLSAAGGYAHGGAKFVYQKGPDGKLYAIGGEVGIDTAPVSGDAQATIQKMQAVRQAALAPANPSAQDRQVAAAASRTEAMARMELSRENLEDLQGENKINTYPQENPEDTGISNSDANDNTSYLVFQAIGSYQNSGNLMEDADLQLVDLFA